MAEANFDFLQRYQEIHKPGRRNPARVAGAGEMEISSGWKVFVSNNFSRALCRAAEDIVDYFKVSMDIQLEITTEDSGKNIIRLIEDAGAKCGFRKIEVSADLVSVTGNAASIAAAVVRLEDEMNFNAAPVLRCGIREEQALASLRSTHSGYACDEFPDWHLNAILHAGFNAIEIFVSDVDKVRRGRDYDLNDLIERAESFGLSTIFYNLVRCYKHPDEEGAQETFDRTYGDLVRRYPKLRAIGFVGESLEFPSRDPHTSGRGRKESFTDGIPDPQPSPGWYPCFDYPAYIARIESAIHSVNPDVEIFFSTYNWGYVDFEARREFIRNLPEHVSLWVPWELFKHHQHGEFSTPVMDYSISAVEPGEFFSSEMEEAAKRNIPFRAFTNFAGCTWDVGCVPYIPVLQRWAKRMLLSQRYMQDGKVDSLYESHHYGWSPSPVQDLGKALLEEPVLHEEEVPEFLLKVAARDYGEAAAEKVRAAWQEWSDSMDYYVCSNEDQYGPWRVGPAYPFYTKFNFTRLMVARKYAFLGGSTIIKLDYEPCENSAQSPGSLRYPVEIADLRKMLEIWNRGLSLVSDALAVMDEKFRPEGERLYALGKFIRNSIITTIHIKEWYLKNIALLASSDRKEMLKIVDELEELLAKEADNVRDTMDCSDVDSRIGWEPTMGYVADREHMEWKLRQLESVGRDLEAERKIIKL